AFRHDDGVGRRCPAARGDRRRHGARRWRPPPQPLRHRPDPVNSPFTTGDKAPEKVEQLRRQLLTNYPTAARRGAAKAASAARKSSEPRINWLDQCGCNMIGMNTASNSNSGAMSNVPSRITGAEAVRASLYPSISMSR